MVVPPFLFVILRIAARITYSQNADQTKTQTRLSIIRIVFMGKLPFEIRKHVV